MKFFGDANLQQNELQNAVLSTLSTFPSSPKVGQLAFVNSIVYICVSLTGGSGDLVIWVPLTREITSFTYVQNTAADEWVIAHGMNTTSVLAQVYTAAGLAFIPDVIQVNSPDQVTLQFNTPIDGRAIILTGHFDGNVKPTYAYTHHQTTSSATWTITHSLGYNPITRIFIGNQEVQPLTITHDDTNNVTITFTSPQVGYVRFI